MEALASVNRNAKVRPSSDPSLQATFINKESLHYAIYKEHDFARVNQTTMSSNSKHKHKYVCNDAGNTSIPKE